MVANSLSAVQTSPPEFTELRNYPLYFFFQSIFLHVVSFFGKKVIHFPMDLFVGILVVISMNSSNVLLGLAFGTEV